MSQRVLITGGAGFIGSHVADELLRRGYQVRALDNLSEQVHGSPAQRPGYLAPDVELLVGDVRDPVAVRAALQDVDAVCHLAAAVGVGQSMYRIANYVSCNNLGTAVLLEALVEQPVQRLIVASSMSIYGEGLYRTSDGRLTSARERSLEQLRRGEWELRDAFGEPLEPLPTPESKTPSLASIYALNKYDQERMCLLIGRAYQLATVALRFFNVYGPRQALSNPYTGVLAIFASRLLNGRAPTVYEDGQQRRDFVSVHDVARACADALSAGRAPGHAINIGSGCAYTINQIAAEVASVLNMPILPEITGKYRAGDIRHCFADISLARELLNYRPAVTLAQGLAELAQWLGGQKAEDRVAAATQELLVRGLAV